MSVCADADSVKDGEYRVMIESPVTEGEFPTGAELMLWRPGLDRTRLRRRTARTALLSLPALYVALGLAIVALGAHAGTTTASLVFVVGGSLLATLNMVRVAVAHRCAEFDHHHGQDRPCLLDRTRGEFFYRPGDFTGLTPTARRSAQLIIESVQLVHASPTIAWLDPQQLNDVHRVAWDALRVLDRTRTLRVVIDDPRSDALPADLVHAQSHVAAVDNTLDRIQACLHQAVFLVLAWEQKLAENDVRTRLRAELDNVPPDMIASALRRAESVPEGIFAYITAARDLTNVGSFEWERAQS